MISNMSKISVFAPPGAQGCAKKIAEILRHPARRVMQKLKFFNMEKNYFFVKNNFFLAIYRSQSFTNVNYG